MRGLYSSLRLSQLPFVLQCLSEARGCPLANRPATKTLRPGARRSRRRRLRVNETPRQIRPVSAHPPFCGVNASSPGGQCECAPSGSPPLANWACRWRRCEAQTSRPPTSALNGLRFDPDSPGLLRALREGLNCRAGLRNQGAPHMPSTPRRKSRRFTAFAEPSMKPMVPTSLMSMLVLAEAGSLREWGPSQALHL